MALNEAPKHGKEYRFGILPEASYGTERNGLICELRCEPVNVDRGIMIRQLRGTEGSMQPTYNERTQNASGSRGSFTITGPINGYAGTGGESPLQVMAQSHFQLNTAEVFSYFSDHPATDGVTHSYTFYRKDPTTARDLVMKGCVNKTFDLTFERGELVIFSCEVDCKDAGLIDQTIAHTFKVSGSTEMTPTAAFEDFYYKIDVGGAGAADCLLKSISIHHGWDDIEGYSPNASGSLDARGFTGITGNTFSFTTMRDDQSVLLDTAYEEGEEVKITIVAGGPIRANWDITDYWCTGKVDNIEYNDDPLTTVTVNCTMLADGSSSNMCELDLT